MHVVQENGEDSHVETINDVPDLCNCPCKGKQIIGLSSIWEMEAKNLRTVCFCGCSGIVGGGHLRRKVRG